MKKWTDIHLAEARGSEAFLLLSLLYYLATLPWQLVRLPTTLGIMLAALVWLLSGDFKGKLYRLSTNRWAGLLLLYYLFLVIGVWRSPDENAAMRELFSKLPVLAWPVLLASGRGFSQRALRLMLGVFIFSTALAMLYSFGESVFRYLQINDPSVFYFSELLAVGRVPPHYMGMYVNFAYGLLLFYLLRGQRLFAPLWLNVCLGLIFILSIIFIWVRMQYLIFILLNLIFFGTYLWRRENRKRAPLLGGLVLSFLLLLLLTPGSRSRLLDTYHEWRSRDEIVEDKQTNPRVFLWAAAAELIVENWWWGVGTAAENKALNARLERIDAPFWDGQNTFQLYEMRHNVHNTYLQHWLANGFFQFLVLLALFLAPTFFFKSHPLRWPASIFLLVTGISFVTESMLERQAGLLFFSFFYTMFFVVLVRPQQPLGGKVGEKDIE